MADSIISPTPQNPQEKQNSQGSTDSLLDELESIKDLLEESSLDEDALDDDLDIDIPILDDVVPGDDNPGASAGNHLLDLQAIFDEDETAPAQPSQVSSETQLNFEGLDIDVEIPSFKLTVENSEAGQLPPDNEIPTLSTQSGPTTRTEPAELILPDEVNLLPTVSTAAAEPTVDDIPATPVPEVPVLEPLVEPAPLKAGTPAPEASQAPKSPDLDVDLIIQELVDEMVPVMEDKLRQRLASYPAEIIRQLASKYLNE